MTYTLKFERAREAYAKAANSCDRTWNAYSKARQALTKHRAKFSAQQRMIDTSQAVADAISRLDVKHGLLWAACYEEARTELFSKARACVPFKAPNGDEIMARKLSLFEEAKRWTPPAPAQAEDVGPLFSVAA